MKTFVSILAAGLVLLALSSCKEHSTQNSFQNALSFSFRTSACVGSGFSKVSGVDSVFTYSFGDTLAIDLSVAGNCCPDSGRFDVIHEPGNDTLFITIIDTADYLCRCNCIYVIHAEIANLVENEYVVRCKLVNVDAPYLSRDPIYLVNVYRKN